MLLPKIFLKTSLAWLKSDWSWLTPWHVIQGLSQPHATQPIWICLVSLLFIYIHRCICTPCSYTYLWPAHIVSFFWKAPPPFPIWEKPQTSSNVTYSMKPSSTLLGRLRQMDQTLVILVFLELITVSSMVLASGNWVLKIYDKRWILFYFRKNIKQYRSI